MSDGWKTIRVPEAEYNAAKSHKETHSETWGDVVAFYANHREGDGGVFSEVTVDAEDMRPMISEEIANAMSEVTLDVTIDGDSDVSEQDVRNIVESKLDAFKEELY